MAVRTEDLQRHLTDLRSGTHEGARAREDKERVFARAVELVDPVVRRVLDEANALFLLGEGTVEATGYRPDGGGGTEARWTLSWPAQRSRGVDPVTVVTSFGPQFTHPHLHGSVAGMWPLQVVTAQDAARQQRILEAIVESELHQRVFEGRWDIIPAASRQR